MIEGIASGWPVIQEKRPRGKLSVLDVYRLSHSRLRLDRLANHCEPAASAMVDGLRILLRRVGPDLGHFKNEEIVRGDERAIGNLGTRLHGSGPAWSWTWRPSSKGGVPGTQSQPVRVRPRVASQLRGVIPPCACQPGFAILSSHSVATRITALTSTRGSYWAPWRG